MLVTLTGAFKNAGDYLIGHRARVLLASHTDHEIVDLNRKELTDQSYELINSAKALLLTGGPAYQKKIFPDIYPLDLDRINVPIVPYGLGWKGGLNQAPEDFKFEPQAEQFVKDIHQGSYFSSARDHQTVGILNRLGIDNAAMTGCPAWYDEEKLANDYEPREIRQLVFSMPAVPQEHVEPLLRYLAKKYPKAKRLIAFNAGYKSTRSKDRAKFTRWNYQMILRAKLLGFSPVSFESDFANFQGVMGETDLHLGFRVHSHIFSLSQRIATALIAEDSRGISQLEALNAPVLTARQPVNEITAQLDQIFATGSEIQRSVETMRSTHAQMLRFIEQFS